METGLWDTVLRTDTEVITKKKLEYNAKNLNDFDAMLFFTGGTLNWMLNKKPISCRSFATMAKDSLGCTARPLPLSTGQNTER